MAAASALTPRRSGGLTGRLAANLARVEGPGREPGIDLARGLAVIGMFAAHLLDITAFEWSDPGTWTDVVNGRSSILFATLAGVSLAIVTGGAQPFEGRPMTYARVRIALRAGCIWFLGILLVVLETPVLVILPAYAILFLLTLPLLRAGVARLFVVAAAVAVTMPFAVFAIDSWDGWDRPLGQTVAHVLGWHYPFLLWAAFLIAGIGVGRLAFSRPLTAGLLTGAGVVLAGVGYGVIGRWALLAPADSLWGVALSSTAHSSGVGEAIGSGGFAIATIGVCTLLCATPVRWLALPLRAVGAMPLTAYTAQLVAWAMLQPPAGVHGSELAAFRALEPFWPLTIATIVGCTLWTLLLGRGPLEWLLARIATAGPKDIAHGRTDAAR
ncbi:heparan-alpha-glucosaminide N-acetyltransferase domain-containing protein [Microbacterium sp.]|uniref:heparan-alpha-glucosaminide N-acetyltransferase domain-containing protein n=1 Tax=Microbacterium sp. TaxID=51671 RepID=UPI0028119192|nr:heparan-alpha-glucosaminide N-acetyltransferase domain-containing protein [Microbacterium sp.]